MAIMKIEVIVRSVHTDGCQACPVASIVSGSQSYVQIKHAFGCRVAHVSIEGSSTMQIFFGGRTIRKERRRRS